MPEPRWILEDAYPRHESYAEESTRQFLERQVLNRKVSVYLTGDLHFYKRHENAEGVQKITSGGGGAFLHPTHAPKTHVLRDGFVPDSPGGHVRLAPDGSPLLDYEMTDYAWDGVRRAWLSMAQAQFAAGAERVRPAHLDAADYRSWPEAREAIARLPLKPFRTALFTAHLMGGCGMSDDPRGGVVDSRGPPSPGWPTCRCSTARCSRPAWARTRNCRCSR